MYLTLMNIIKPAKFTNAIADAALSINSRMSRGTHENKLFIWPSPNGLLNPINHINVELRVHVEAAIFVQQWWILLMRNALILTLMYPAGNKIAIRSSKRNRETW